MDLDINLTRCSLAVLIPNYRAPLDLVARCIRSTTSNSSYIDTCVILWDDGSGNSYVKQLLGYLESENLLDKFSFRHSNSNLGIGATRDFLLSIVSSDYYLFLDSDDYLLPGWLEIIQQLIRSSSSAGSILKFPFTAQTRYNNLNSSSIVNSFKKILLTPPAEQSDDTTPILTERISPTLWATLYPATTLREYPSFMTGLRNFEDVVFSQYLYERFNFEWHPEAPPVYSYTILQSKSITGAPFHQADLSNVSRAVEILYRNAIDAPQSQIVAFLASYAIPVLFKKILRTSLDHKCIALVSAIKCFSVIFRCYNIKLVPSMQFALRLDGLSLKRKLLYVLLRLCTPIAR